MRSWQHVPPKSVLIVVTALTLVVAGACGGGSSQSKPADQKASPSSAPQTAVAKSPAAVASSTPVAAPSPKPAATGPISLVAKNLLFDKKTLSATAGSVTIEFDNQDSGVPHNLHVFKGSDATGASLGSSEIAAGPVKQSLKADVTAGAYYFQCDVHPTTMLGTITVS